MLHQFITSLVTHVVLLLWLLPLLGVVLVALMQRLGGDTVRRTARTNVLLTAALAALLVTQYRPGPGEGFGPAADYQLAAAIGWAGLKVVVLDGLPAADIQIAVAVDGLSLWFIVFTVFATLAAVLTTSGDERQRPAVYYMLVLLLESALIGVFAATDLVFLLACGTLAQFAAGLLIGGFGGPQRRRIILRFLIGGTVSGLLIAMALLGTVSAQTWMQQVAEVTTEPAAPTFSIPVLLTVIPELTAVDDNAWSYWQQASPWIFLLLVAGLAVRAPLVPLHPWLAGSQSEAPAAVLWLLSPLSAGLAAYGFLRFAVPLFPDALLPMAGLLTAAALGGALLAALLALASHDRRRVILHMGLSHLGIAAAALVSLHPVGIAGGLLLVLHHGLVLGGLCATNPARRDLRTTGRQPYGGPISFSQLGVPGLFGFAGLWLSLLGIYESPSLLDGHLPRVLTALAAILLSGWALLRRRGFETKEDDGDSHVLHESDSPDQPLLRWSLAVAVIVPGLAPWLLTDRMQDSITAALSPYFEEPNEDAAGLLLRPATGPSSVLHDEGRPLRRVLLDPVRN